MGIKFNIVQDKNSVIANRKERDFNRSYSLYLLDARSSEGSPHELIRVNFYSTKAMSYAVIWFYGSEIGYAGARVRGYGFNHESAVFEKVLEKVGIELDYDRGQGDLSIRNTLNQIAEAHGSSDYFIAEAQG